MTSTAAPVSILPTSTRTTTSPASRPRLRRTDALFSPHSVVLRTFLRMQLVYWGADNGGRREAKTRGARVAVAQLRASQWRDRPVNERLLGECHAARDPFS